MLYCVLSMITACFGLRKRPSSGDYRDTKISRRKLLFVATDPLSQKYDNRLICRSLSKKLRNQNKIRLKL
jgi:hypothetical protein